MSPFDRKRYPADWEAISKAIRRRARNRCECRGECGLHRAKRCEERNGKPAKWARGVVILTVAHMGTGTGDKHDKMDCRPENLKAMCQRCHLRFDHADHMRHAAHTRHEKVARASVELPMKDEADRAP